MRKRSLFVLFVICSLFFVICCVGCGLKNGGVKGVNVVPQLSDLYIPV